MPKLGTVRGTENDISLPAPSPALPSGLSDAEEAEADAVLDVPDEEDWAEMDVERAVSPRSEAGLRDDDTTEGRKRRRSMGFRGAFIRSGSRTGELLSC